MDRVPVFFLCCVAGVTMCCDTMSHFFFFLFLCVFAKKFAVSLILCLNFCFLKSWH